jgi:predicted transcriptional regulator
MLGIKFDPSDEERLERFARETKRPKSSLAREWIIDRLDREEIDRKIANAVALDAEERKKVIDIPSDDATSAWLRSLDAEDGGYDWGPKGPPVEK